MSFTAPAILSTNKFLASYTDVINLNGLVSAGIDWSSLPRVHVAPLKNTTEPTSEYHKWLENFGNNPDINFLEERCRYVKEAKKQSENNDFTSPPKPLDIPTVQPYLKASKMKKSATRRRRVDSDDEVEEEIKEMIVDTVEEETRVRDGNFIGTDSETDWSDEVKTPSLPTTAPVVQTPSLPTTVPPSIYSQQQQADFAFRILPNLHWRDKDEFKMSASALNKIFTNDLMRIYPIMIQLADDLDRAVSASTGALDALTPDEKRNFLFHVIAKGESMYYQSIADPDFCLYMLDQYQPLYTMMKNKYEKLNKSWYRAD